MTDQQQPARAGGDTERMEATLRVVLREMQEYAWGWRADWADFDGRTLRDQMTTLAQWAERRLADDTLGEFRGGSNFRVAREG